MKPSLLLLSAVFLIGATTVCEALQVVRDSPVTRLDTKPWWDWSDVKAQLNLTGGLDTVSFTKNPKAPFDLFWWQLMDGKYMTNRTTCNSFSYDQDFQASQWDGNAPAPQIPPEECADFIKKTYDAYLAASAHVGEPWEVDNLIAVNKALRGEINMTRQMEMYEISEETFTPVVARDNQMTEDEQFRDKAGIAPLKTACEELFPESWFVRGKNLACVRANKKKALLKQYMTEYYASLTKMPAPAARTPEEWEKYLDVVTTLLVRIYELHPFLDGNSRTRLIFLDVLLAENGLHPVLGLYNIKSPTNMKASIKEGLKLWETTVLTGRNAWLEHKHVSP